MPVAYAYMVHRGCIGRGNCRLWRLQKLCMYLHEEMDTKVRKKFCIVVCMLLPISRVIPRYLWCLSSDKMRLSVAGRKISNVVTLTKSETGTTVSILNGVEDVSWHVLDLAAGIPLTTPLNFVLGKNGKLLTTTPVNVPVGCQASSNSAFIDSPDASSA